MRIIDVLTSPWAIVPAKLQEISEIYSTHLRGEKIDLKAVEAQIGAPLNNKPQGYEVVDGVAVIQMDGVISKKMNLFTKISGGVSTQLLERDFRQALSDPAVHSILLNVDSPGGTVDGTLEMARVIRESRGTKPVVALADGLMASAAYWIGSAADQVYITGDTTEVGSIGVVAEHVDWSKQLDMRGIRVTEITAGKYKRIASDVAPLSQEGRQYIQDMLDHIYTAFVGDVAKHRGSTPDTVHEKMADGRIFIGQKAIDVGLADGVSTMSALIAMLNDKRTSAAKGAVAPKSNPKGQTNMEHVIVCGATCTTQEQVDAAVKTAVDKAKTEASAAGVEQAKAEGAKAERERIQGVEAVALPGHEKLVAEAKFDGKTTGEQLAAKIVAAEKERLSATAANLKKDAPNPAPASTDEGKGKEKPQQDPKVLAAEAQKFIDAEAKEGRKVSYSDAVAHVSKAQK